MMATMTLQTKYRRTLKSLHTVRQTLKQVQPSAEATFTLVRAWCSKCDARRDENIVIGGEMRRFPLSLSVKEFVGLMRRPFHPDCGGVWHFELAGENWKDE